MNELVLTEPKTTPRPMSLLEKKVELEVTSEARAWLARHGFDDKLGARPVGRLVDEKIKKPLAHEILFGRLEKGGRVVVDEGVDGPVFKFS